MNESSLLLILVLAALAIHGAVSLMNAALQNLSRADMRERAEDGDARAQRYLALMDSGLQLSMTVSIAHILTRFAIAVILVLLVIEPVANGDAGARALLALMTILLGTGLTLVIGDLAPDAIGSSHAENLQALAIPSMRILLFVIGPLTALVLLLSRLISRIFGSDTLVNLVTEEEIMTLVYASHSGGIIEAEEKDMIASVLQLGESNARELMIPRIDIVALDVEDTIMQALAAFVESGFFPYSHLRGEHRQRHRLALRQRYPDRAQKSRRSRKSDDSRFAPPDLFCA